MYQSVDAIMDGEKLKEEKEVGDRCLGFAKITGETGGPLLQIKNHVPGILEEFCIRLHIHPWNKRSSTYISMIAWMNLIAHGES